MGTRSTPYRALLALAGHSLLAGPAHAGPTCLERVGDEPTAATFARASLPDEEVLARLTYAEATSTGFPDDPLVHRAIAWGTMNRVRLAARSASARARYGDGVPGVVFKPGQFHPAVSTRSRFSRDFLCPDQEGRWALATGAAAEAVRGEGNPFLNTDWERANGLSLVVNFYYPTSVQARGPLAPWESDAAFAFVGPVAIGDQTLGPERVRFYRRTDLPSDLVP